MLHLNSRFYFDSPHRIFDALPLSTRSYRMYTSFYQITTFINDPIPRLTRLVGQVRNSLIYN